MVVDGRLDSGFDSKGLGLDLFTVPYRRSFI